MPATASPSQANGTWISTTSRAISGNRVPRRATNTSGKVTVRAMVTSTQSENVTTSLPSTSPTSLPYAAPSTASASGSPATATIPVVTPTTTSAIHEEDPTCLATAFASSPARVSGTDVTSASAEAVTVTTPDPAR